MGKGPDVPDPYATADAQSEANFKNAQQNFGFQNVNEVTPYGSKTYAQSGWYDVVDPKTGKVTKTPQYQSTVNLSPQEQAILDQNTAMRSNIGRIGVQQSDKLFGHLSGGPDLSQLSDWKTGPEAAQLATSFGGQGDLVSKIGSQDIRQDMGATDRDAIEKALMERYERQAGTRNEAEEAQMANRGLSPGGQGYASMRDAQGRERTEMQTNAFLASGDESRKAQDAYNTASMTRFGQEAAQGAFSNQTQAQRFAEAAARAGFGNEALSQMFSMGGQSADRANALRGQQYQEAMTSYHDPINVAMALQEGSQVNTPQFQPYQGSTMQAPNIGQMVYDSYNAEQQNYQNKMSGVFGIGNAIAGAMPWAKWLG